MSNNIDHSDDNKEFSLSFLGDSERLKIYEFITSGVHHLWSKNKLQKNKFKEMMEVFIRLAEKDPYFLAHFTSYAMTVLDSKDLKVLSVFANSLSDADGTSFSIPLEDGSIKKSEYKKPNLRIVSQAALQMLDPKLVMRVCELASCKEAYGTKYSQVATHFSGSLKTALKKYLVYRENNLYIVKGIQKSALGRIYRTLYRVARISPSTEVAEILRWSQKDGRKIKKSEALSFKGMSDKDIALKIRNDKINPLKALGALSDKLSPAVAVAILEQTTGNQAVILQSMFDTQGLLKDKEVVNLFSEKINTAKDALDRVERINSSMTEDVSKVLLKAKSDRRKEEFGEIGKLFLHIDISSSMEGVIEFAKQRGAIIAECVKNPENNFFWGAFNERGYMIEKPSEFTQGAFMQKLYGIRATGMTNCMACYKAARQLNCDVDIFLTDQEHNKGDIDSYIKNYGKPKSVVIVYFPSSSFRTPEEGSLYKAFIKNQIPVAILKPESITGSALVVQAIKSAALGSIAIIDEIMSTPLLQLPKWWESIKKV